MSGTLRTAALVIGFTSAPGVLADLVVRLIQALKIAVFPLMAPGRVPHEMAIYVTQWWLTILGVALLAAVAHNWWRERRAAQDAASPRG